MPWLGGTLPGARQVWPAMLKVIDEAGPHGVGDGQEQIRAGLTLKQAYVLLSPFEVL